MGLERYSSVGTEKHRHGNYEKNKNQAGEMAQLIKSLAVKLNSLGLIPLDKPGGTTALPPACYGSISILVLACATTN